jgi:hypothetical protein
MADRDAQKRLAAAVNATRHLKIPLPQQYRNDIAPDAAEEACAAVPLNHHRASLHHRNL